MSDSTPAPQLEAEAAAAAATTQASTEAADIAVAVPHDEPTQPPTADTVASSTALPENAIEPETIKAEVDDTQDAAGAVPASPPSQDALPTHPPRDPIDGPHIKAPAAEPSQDAPLTADPSSSNEDTVMTDPVVYGTRSRHRTAGSRINYAEDQDNMDFEYSSAAKADPKKEPSLKRATDPVDSRSRVADTTGSDSRNSTPTTSTNTKKRKAAAAAAAQPATTASSAPSAPQNSSAVQSLASTTRKSHSNHAGTPPPRRPETNVMSFSKTNAKLNKHDQLVADDNTVISVDDHVYLICEPPGDPYYLCRIMEFMHSKSDDPTSSIDAVRVNWFYRPRDVQRYSNDTRLVYGTMHSDICPLTSLRGKCTILHRSDIDDLDQYRKLPDHFWFNQIFDRFIRRWYEVIPTSQVINVPENVKKALDERWKFIAVEASRVKELTSAVKLCKRCSQYCATNDSVECAMCGNCYHMNCVRPPLPKKPSRGFAWACGPCSRAQEMKLEARHGPRVGPDGETIEDEIFEEEEEEPNVGDSTRAPSPDADADAHPATQAEIELAKMWPMRYLGIHCRVEDALQYDDRAIYPRASSRLGPRHQAITQDWYGRPVELTKPLDIKKKFVKTGSHKKDTKLSKESMAAIEADRAERAKRPKWVQDEPAGYLARGEDFANDDPRNTATLMFKMPTEDDKHTLAANEDFITSFMQKAQALAKPLRVSEYGVNLMDKALSLLIDNNYDEEVALAQLAKVDRGKDLKEPIFTHDDLKKFEEGVSKYGSEHRLIKQHMKTHLPVSSIIRFYYLWKKTPRGHQIWDNYGGRKSTKKKRANVDEATKIQQQVADDADDSAFDSGKAAAHKRDFQCKFCNRKHSPQWRRAPGVSPGQTAPPEKNDKKDKNGRPLLALCLRCAGLWRKYAIQWEEQDEVARKVAQGGGKAWKRRIDEELLKELQIESNYGSRETSEADMTPDPTVEPAKKKTKTAENGASKAKAVVVKQPTPPPPPIVPEAPILRELPCFICNSLENANQRPISCTHCKLTVHKHCYGLADEKIGTKWVCDQCTNDRTPLVSTDYVCNLCPIEFTPHDLWEPPRVSHKKKTDRDREKEKLEKDLLDKAKAEYTKRQADLNRPLQPREPLKRTDGNNWVHVLCAVWTPEIKFSTASKLERAEGFTAIPLAKYEAVCKLCKGAQHGACVPCHHCHANFHVACAFEAGHVFGFDVTPVKGSRKDQTTTVTLGPETGHMTAAIWCRDHTVKTIIHPMNEIVDDKGTTALQLFVQNYKQADQTLTGTARKANLLSSSVRAQTQTHASTAPNRRVSVITTGPSRKGRNSIIGGIAPDDTEGRSPTANREASVSDSVDKKCTKCGIEVSPKWWPLPNKAASHHSGVNGVHNEPLGTNGVSQIQLLECHKCHLLLARPQRRIPLSPKPLSFDLGWPPCLADPPPETKPHRSGWDQPAVLTRPGESAPPPPSYARTEGWGYSQPPGPFPPPSSFGHHSVQPPQPHIGPSLPAPQPNGGHPYGRYETSLPPVAPGPPGPPHAAPSAYPPPPNSGYYDRPPPRAGPPPQMPLAPVYTAPPPSHLHSAPPPHLPPPPPRQPGPSASPFPSRASASPYLHHAAPSVTPRPVTQSPALPPATPRPGDPRPPGTSGASNSPHIGNLLS